MKQRIKQTLMGLELIMHMLCCITILWGLKRSPTNNIMTASFTGKEKKIANQNLIIVQNSSYS